MCKRRSRRQTYLASLVLGDLVGGVLAALLALAVGVPRLGNVDLCPHRVSRLVPKKIRALTPSTTIDANFSNTLNPKTNKTDSRWSRWRRCAVSPCWVTENIPFCRWVSRRLSMGSWGWEEGGKSKRGRGKGSFSESASKARLSAKPVRVVGELLFGLWVEWAVLLVHGGGENREWRLRASARTTSLQRF